MGAFRKACTNPNRKTKYHTSEKEWTRCCRYLPKSAATAGGSLTPQKHPLENKSVFDRRNGGRDKKPGDDASKPGPTSTEVGKNNGCAVAAVIGLVVLVIIVGLALAM